MRINYFLRDFFSLPIYRPFMSSDGSFASDSEYMSDYTHSPKRRHVSSVRILSSADIRAIQTQYIGDLRELIAEISSDEAFALLTRFEWRPETIQEIWFEKGEDEIRAITGLLPTSALELGVTMSDALGSCQVCFTDPVACVSFGCSHFTCTDCIVQYMEIKISERVINIPCPGHKCGLVGPLSLVRKLVDYKSYEKLIEWSVSQFVTTCDQKFRFCPNPVSCSLIAQKGGDRTTAITCSCTYRWCWECRSEDHLPTSCDRAKTWAEKNSSESENVAWIAANTKPCPKCERPIEKNQGCNHMMCPKSKGGCGTAFCWLCLRLWSGHNGGHYTCNEYVSIVSDPKFTKAERVRENAQTHLARYMFHFERFMNHQKAGDLAKREISETVPDQVQSLHDRFDIDMAELDFLEKALVQVIECRRVLKWTYVESFYEQNNLVVNSKKKSTTFNGEVSLFSHIQKNLEEYTDRLHEYIEKDLVGHFFPASEESSSPPTPDDVLDEETKAVMKSEFFNFRSQVCNYTAVTKNFCASIAQG
jgi:ariadne-1